jgi:hypothetical protein
MTRNQSGVRWSILAATIVAIGVLSGCSNIGSSGGVTTATPEEIRKSQDAQIQAIQNSKSMPESAKQSAIAAIRGNMQVGQQMTNKDNQGTRLDQFKKDGKN